VKSLYWRSNSVSTPQLVVVALLSVVGSFWIECNPTEERGALYEQKLQAARLAKQAFQSIYLERIRLQLPVDPALDPAGTGLIGHPHTEITSNEGHLESKQTTANPNFAAAFVDMLHEAGVDEGDVVAVNCTGSFPAMNVTIYAALETMGAEPIVISSASSSEYGATYPELTWLDMERILFEQDLISFKSIAASMGGTLDVARSHSERGRELLRAAIERNKVPLLYPNDFAQAVEMRVNLYDEYAQGRPIAAFINLGGGTASVGTSDDKSDFKPGLNTRLPKGLDQPSVMRTYLERGVPVIHVSKIRSLARRYGLPDAPVEMPDPGEGEVFHEAGSNRWSILGLLALIFTAMFAATRYDMSSLFSRAKREGQGPEQMV